MKSKFPSQRYARKSDGLHATVCKDIPPVSERPVIKSNHVPEGKFQRKVCIPPEYEAALQEMYPNVSVAIAIRKFIVENVHPAKLAE